MFFRFDLQGQSYWIYSPDGQISKGGKDKQVSSEMKPVVHDISVGDAKEITIASSQKDNNTDDNFETSEVIDDFGQQMPRQFKHDGLNTVYIKGYVMNRPENGNEMIIPSLEFKYFRKAVEKGDPMKKFLAETLRFACGCLNRRRNGTIYFGVADDKLVEGQKHKHGEIIGFPMVGIDTKISKDLFTDKLGHAKHTRFITNKSTKAVEECIGPPRFVLVQPSSRELPLYVMEVDIEPSFVFCEGVTFKVDLSNLIDKKVKPVLYVRDDSSTKGITDKVEEDNFTLNLEKFDQKRKQDEEIITCSKPVRCSRKYLTDKLCRKLCKETQVFDESLWHILVTSKPTLEGRETLLQSLPFISNIRWSAVLDFDDESFKDGLCKNFFMKPFVKHEMSGKFQHIAYPEKFRSELGFPEKTVYVFCNGKVDSNIPHLNERDWEDEFSPGVKGAINFLQQKSVIPVGRARVIFLLLSSNLEGFLDTFKEIKTYFKVENIVLLCEDETVFNVFKLTAVQRNIASEKELEECSVVGMTWEQASNVFNKLLGEELRSVTMIPSSTRSDVEVDRQVLEGLDCLSILGSNECETREFDSDLEEKQFAYSKDLKFYQGSRVQWWNFHFKDQVVERSCFEKLKEKVDDALRGPKGNNRTVLTISLTHEPGAGGSTLARNILWHFRKKHRCAVVSELKEKTAVDIIDLWKYKEREENAVPVLILIDSSAAQGMFVELHRLISKQILGKLFPFTPPVCVFLVCTREFDINVSNPRGHFDVENNERLYQKLDKREQKLFREKIVELEQTSSDLGLVNFKGEHILSFMILHHNFNSEYIKNTVQTLLSTMDVDGCGYKLTMCVALFVAFVTPSRNGPPVTIPLECCDELMGHTGLISRKVKINLWEDRLERAEKILLLIETKENGSGKEIRMTHPNLARAVIECMKEKCIENDSSSGDIVNRNLLANIVMTVLESKLLQSTSHAVKYVYGLVVQMLTKRKKEEYGDSGTTKFSPLIESICEEDSSTCEHAAAVMKKAFDIINDGSIAQQMARLYLHYGKVVEARKWAEKAVDVSPNLIFIHTLGHVIKQTFRSSQVYRGELYLEPSNEKLKVEMDRIFEALHQFEKASCCENQFNLFACLDTLETVNMIVEFLSVNLMRSDEDSEEFHRYLTEESYIFDYIDRSLSKHRSGFKSLFRIGMKAIQDLDEDVYYKVTIYASQFSGRHHQEHRTSRAVKKRLPELIVTFTDFFGEKVENPPIYIQSTEMLDKWHRRRVLQLCGNRLIAACDLVSKCRSSRSVEEAKSKLEKAHEHLERISEKETEDLLNLITFNFAAIHLQCKKICTPMKDLLSYCKFVITNGKERQKKCAYMYAIMLLWPRKGIKTEYYDRVLMEKAVRYLADAFKEFKQHRSRYELEYGEVFNKQNNIVRSVPIFYEGKGKGISSLIYKREILGSRDFLDMNEDFWEKQTNLRPMKGITQIGRSGAVSVLVDSSEFEISHQIVVTAFQCRKPDQNGQTIEFYMAFSMYGPAVCYILQDKGSSLSRSSSWIESSEYDSKSEGEIRQLLQHLETLKRKSELTANEKKLLREEDLVRDALLKFEPNIDLIE